MSTIIAGPLLNDIAIFVEVARARHFSRAALALGMPVSTVSRRIRELEKEVGVALLKRSTRNVDVTEAGQVYFERCLAIVEQARLAHEQLLDVAQTPKGRLRVSMPASFSIVLMPAIIRGFNQQYPDIELEFDLTIRPIDLQSDNYDCVIRVGAQPDSSAVATLLGQIRLGLYATRNYLDRKGRPKHPSELTGHTCICARPSGPDRLWSLRGPNQERYDAIVDGSITVNNAIMMRKLAVHDLGITASSLLERRLDPDCAQLERVLPDWEFAPFPVLALLPSRLMPQKTRVFLNYLRSELDRLMSHAELDVAAAGQAYP